MTAAAIVGGRFLLGRRPRWAWQERCAIMSAGRCTRQIPLPTCGDPPQTQITAARDIFCAAEQNCRRALDPTRSLPGRTASPPGARARSWTAPSPDLPQAVSGPVDRLSTGDAVADVKKNWVTWRPIYHDRCSRFSRTEGTAVHFLARVGMPHRRGQAAIGQPDLRGPKC